MNPYYQNQSCDPYTATNRSCELGNYVSYAINVSGPVDVSAGLQFAKNFNIRLVVKNTGHDFLGKSTGKGGLSLWMYNMKTSDIIQSYSDDDSTWTGLAVKLGAGMTGYDAIQLVGPAGYTIVSGDCPTVGITGGYTQGGGHSFLNSEYGMAADQVLEWEVITADANHLFVSPSKSPDLYWALSGGGAGTYAVVLSMTVKLHPESRVGAATLSFNSSASAGNGSYTTAVQAWWQFLPQLVDTGANVLWAIESGISFLESFTALNRTADQVHEMFKSYLSELDALGVRYEFSSSEEPSYFSHYNASNGPLPYGVYPTTMLFNSRIIPRLISEDADRALNLTVTMQNAVDQPTAADWSGWGLGCSAFNVAKQSHPDNAVAPFWRDAIAICIEIALWDWTIPRQDMLDRKLYMADVITPTIEAATPEGGAYLNEADPWVYRDDVAHWQAAFYGSNYPRLRQIKDEWDPDAVFYAYTAVGSEDWEQDTNGRLYSSFDRRHGFGYELSYIDPGAWKGIMGRPSSNRRKENAKAPWHLHPNGKNILGAPYEDHARMRRLMSNGFSAKAMKEQQPLIIAHINLLIQRLHEKCEGGKSCVDLRDWYNYLTFDIIGELAFGEPFGCLRESAVHPWISLICSNIRLTAYMLVFKRMPIFWLLSPFILSVKLVRQFLEHRRVSRTKIARRLADQKARPDFIQHLLAEKETMSREEIENNAVVLTLAGSETTATALTGATFLLGNNPRVMSKLYHELKRVFEDESAIDLLSVAKLPYLCAVTEESLRCYPPGPNSQPRITPPEGSMILQRLVPGNTIVGIPHRAMYMSKENFAQADQFLPERWLSNNRPSAFAQDRKDCFNPFSHGPRNCIGMNLAYAQFR